MEELAEAPLNPPVMFLCKRPRVRWTCGSQPEIRAVLRAQHNKRVKLCVPNVELLLRELQHLLVHGHFCSRSQSSRSEV